MIRIRESPLGLLSHAKAIRDSSREYVGEDARHGRAVPTGADVPEFRVTLSRREELPCDRTNTIDRPSGEKLKLRISPFSKRPCEPFHFPATETTSTTATTPTAISNSFRRLGITWFAVVVAENSIVGPARFSRYDRTPRSIAIPIANHHKVPSTPQAMAATVPKLALVNITAKATNEIGKSATRRTTKGTADGPFSRGCEKMK